MKVHRLPALALAVASLLAMGWVLGAGACDAPANLVPNCFVPNLTEDGADGGPDPCHCNISPPYADSSCPCASTQLQGDTGLTGVQIFHDCMSLLPLDAGDAAEGGPLPACNGACWPPPPAYWMSPLLLWFGPESSAPDCPGTTPFVYYTGNAGGTFALACVGGASGTCPVPGEVCGPAYADGFQQCVIREGEVDCPVLGPFTEQYVFYEDGQPVQASTFCCFPSPPPTQ